MLSREPDLDPEEIEFLNAYSLLRNQSGAGPISVSDILAYCQITGVTDIEAYLVVIVGADTEFQKAAMDYQKKEAQKMKRKARTKK